jgi:hypothetical protein
MLIVLAIDFSPELDIDHAPGPLPSVACLRGGRTAPCTGPASAQTVKCYRKKCLEYPDGYKICTLTPVDCNEMEIL